MYADLGAERAITAERNGQKLVVEVKSFIGASKIQDLKEALGQYDIYHYLLEESAPDRRLYIAVSKTAYNTFFTQDVIQLKYVGTIKPKTQNAVLPASRATQHFGFWV